MSKFDCCGWATKINLKCSDGRTIVKNAFKHQDGATVPLVWNHKHGDPENVLGYAKLEHRDEGVYAYCTFNNTERGQLAKELVAHGDITSFSIYANQLKQEGGNVVHGMIRELSLVLAGANPGANIEVVMAHSDGTLQEIIIESGEPLELEHNDEEKETETMENEKVTNEELVHNEEAEKAEENEDEETLADVFDTLTDKQKNAVYGIVGMLMEEKESKSEENKEEMSHEDKGGNETMKTNVFDQDQVNVTNYLSHADGEAILELAKTKSVGSLQDAIKLYCETNDKSDALAHGIDEIETLFPEYKDVKPGAPEFIERDQGWVSAVMKGVHKSPISRIRTRQADIRGTDLKALGYEKGDEKKYVGNIKLLNRTTDPQTVYRKDKLERDDIIDITDFDVVQYQYYVMKQNLNETIATAIMIGDGLEDGDEGKIYEEHIRSILNDDELYAIHADVDMEAMKAELNGSETGAHFGENYIYAEAIIQSALYAREQYKGSGNLSFFCTPHLLNVMLLARDLNGRRIYTSKSDLQAALDAKEIHTAEQFTGKTRKDKDGNVKSLLGIFVNLNDYRVGSTKGGEITKFEQFDIDFNQYKYLIETRLSGALVRIKSAIVLEEASTAAEDQEV